MRSNRRRLNSNVDSVFEIPRRSILNQMNHWTGGQIADEATTNINSDRITKGEVYMNSNKRRNKSKVGLNSADQGFIKIGNKVIPTNTMDMGYADYDTVAKRGKAMYDADEKAKQEAAQRAEWAKKGENLYTAFSETVGLHEGSINELDDLLNDLLVPASGMADTFAGELIRAIERIGYRYNNDGDYFYGDYGLETAGGSACFLRKYGNDKIQKIIDNMAEHELDWPGYGKAIDQLYQEIVDMLDDNPELFGQPAPEDSRECYDSIMDKWAEDHSFEFEISLEDFSEAVQNGWLTEWEIDDWIRQLAQENQGEYNHPYRDYWYISNLPSWGYEELDRNYVRWVEEWISDLAAEHEDEYEEEYHDEDEEEED